jgi:hypothetical protein
MAHRAGHGLGENQTTSRGPRGTTRSAPAGASLQLDGMMAAPPPTAARMGTPNRGWMSAHDVLGDLQHLFRQRDVWDAGEILGRFAPRAHNEA